MLPPRQTPDHLSEASKAGRRRTSNKGPKNGDGERLGARSYSSPTSYLLDSEFRSQLVELCQAPFMSADEYQEGRSNPAQCNLRLRAANATPEDIDSFGALLPAMDACRLSPVIKAQLQHCFKPTAEGRIELELQIDVEQQILDRVVWAVYGRKLLVDSSSAESLLLVADYLQMDWLKEAVASFAEERLLSTPSLDVCKLAAAYPCLGIFSGAAVELIALVPEAEVLVDLILMASEVQRAVILKAVSDSVIEIEQRVAYLLSLSRHPEVGLTRLEAVLLVEPQPSLERSISQHEKTQGFKRKARDDEEIDQLTPKRMRAYAAKTTMFPDDKQTENYVAFLHEFPSARAMQDSDQGGELPELVRKAKKLLSLHVRSPLTKRIKPSLLTHFDLTTRAKKKAMKINGITRGLLLNKSALRAFRRSQEGEAGQPLYRLFDNKLPVKGQEPQAGTDPYDCGAFRKVLVECFGTSSDTPNRIQNIQPAEIAFVEAVVHLYLQQGTANFTLPRVGEEHESFVIMYRQILHDIPHRLSRYLVLPQ